MAKYIDPKEQERAQQMHAEFLRKERGATLRVAEVDGVAHPDSRDIRKRILDAGRTYPKKEKGSTLEQKIAEREAKLAADKFQAKIQDKSLSVEERELLQWKRDHEAELDAADETKRVEDHKQRPRTVKLLTEAQLLRQRIVQDSSRELSEIDFADLVIAALSDPDAEPQAANALLTQLRDSENTRVEKAKFERQSKIAALQGELSALEQQVEATTDDYEIEAREAERQQATKEKLSQQRAEREARFAKAMALVDAGKYAEANAVIDGAEV